MKIINNNETLFAEKYRPQCLEDMILPDKTIEMVKKWIDNKDIPHLGFFGTGSGTGKTSLNKVIIKELGFEDLFINSSIERGIDTAREKITSYAMSRSIDGNYKIISMSECDGMSQDLQKAIRDLVDSSSKNCRFIFTANYTKDILQPVLDRLTIINFDELFQENKKEILIKMAKRLKFICDNENIEYDVEDLKTLVKNNFPCIRKSIIELQKAITNDKKLNRENIKTVNDNDFHLSLLQEIKNKNFKNARQLISVATSLTSFYDFVYMNCEKIFKDEKSLIDGIIILNNYMNMLHTSRDKEITLAGFVASLIRQDLNYH